MAQIKNSIFNKKKLKYQIEKVNFNDISDFQNRLELVNKWIGFVNSASFYKSKETELQGNFLFDVFGKVLGYTSMLNNPIEWNLNQEQVTTGGKFADGSLGFYSSGNEIIRVVIELKDANTNLDEKQHRHHDNRTPIEQAFGYQHKIGKDCKWVIVSNFNEIRLYHHSSSIEYEQFFIKDLIDEEKLKRFFFLLGKDNLIAKDGNSAIDSLFISNEQDEQEITKKFYAAFKDIRLKFFDHLKTNNPSIDENILLEKTQKLLDRFIFICFAEDNRLLPETIFKNMVKAAKLAFSYSETKVWTELKGLFNAINIGSPPHNINKFNGGLFAADEVLDSLQIKDQILEDLSSITDYDFESDVSIDILGHIFEQSISDLEEIKASINGEVFEKSKSKRKRDGIVYTPAYITRDIVEKAVGGWLEDRKIELGYYDLPELTDEDYKTIINNRGKITYNDKIKQHLEFWYAYRERLMNIKVLDPACGSGAFLIQVFDFLYAEGNKVNDTIAKLLGGQYEVFQLDKHILSNNIYGVDINSESVEITKLSLWLKTANKNAELTSLDNNIKCGNSLIDDPEVAGDKAFDWEKEFPEIMQDKVINEDLKAYHVTWATFNSRVSERMIAYENIIALRREQRGEPILKEPRILTVEEEIFITNKINEIKTKYKYKIIGFNICEDHVHLALVCKDEEISSIVRTIKSITSRELNILNGQTIIGANQHIGASSNASGENESGEAFGLAQMKNAKNDIGISSNASSENDGGEAFGLAQMKNVKNDIGASSNASSENDGGEAFGLAQMKKSNERGLTQNHLWQSKYNSSIIKSEEELHNVLHYISNNRIKHELGNNDELTSHINDLITPLGEAFAPVVLRGGFDVVVGNPPYVRSRGVFNEIEKNYYLQNYQTASYQLDLYKLFVEKSCVLINSVGKLSFITPSVFLNNDNDKALRKYLLDNFSINYIAFSNKDIFENVSVKTVVFLLSANKSNNEVEIFRIDNSMFIFDYAIRQSSFVQQGYLINEKLDNTSINIINKLNNFDKLGNYFEIKNGIKVRKELLYDRKIDDYFKPFILGKNIHKYYNSYDNIFIDYRIENETLYTNQAFRTKDIFEIEKLIVRQILGNRIITCYDNNNFYTDQTTYVIFNDDIIKLKLLLCLLNSKLIYYYFINTFSDNKLTFPKVKRSQLLEIPYNDNFQSNGIITLADTMLDKNKELQEKNSKFQELLKADFNIEKLNTKLENWYNLSWTDFVNELKKLKITLSGEMKEDWIERFNRYKSHSNELQNIIQTTDKKIDQLVYELYGLTEEEIKVVEGE